MGAPPLGLLAASKPPLPQARCSHGPAALPGAPLLEAPLPPTARPAAAAASATGAVTLLYVVR